MPRAAQSSTPLAGLTLAQLAQAKGLPVEFLRDDLGLCDVRYERRPAVAIPYRDAAGPLDDRLGAAQSSASPTDARILVVLADGPLPTAAIAARLGASERTVRHRLMRLRQSGRVVALPDGGHRLAGSVEAPAARQEGADVTAGEGGAAVRGQFGKAAVLVALAAVAAIAALVALAANGRRPASPTALPAARPPLPGWGRPDSSW